MQRWPWWRHTSEANLSDLETSFVVACRRVARRARWSRRLLVVVAVATVLGVIAYRYALSKRTAEQIYHAVYRVDGTRLITAGDDSAVRIWDAAGGTLLHELRQQRHDGKQSRYFVVAMSSDGRLVAGIDTMGEIAHGWDAGTGTPLASLCNDASESPCLAFSADTAGSPRAETTTFRVFDTKAWAHVLTLGGAHSIKV